MVIWKFTLSYPLVDDDGSQIVEMPEDAEILCLHEQDGKPQIWAKVDQHRPRAARKIFMVGTGQPFPEGADEYLGTVQIGMFVWHYFEESK